MNLHQLPIGQKASVALVKEGPLQVALIELGFIPNKVVEVLFSAPFNGPLAVIVNQTVLSMRREEAEQIEVVL
ncbi:MAG: ferrous iron transport protein A [Lentimonas sp.]|jgi:ferrous iron transport protein A